MKSTRNVNKAPNKKNEYSNATVEVLYQRMGDRWFAFSLINDEVFFGTLNPNELDTAQKKNKTSRSVGNT